MSLSLLFNLGNIILLVALISMSATKNFFIKGIIILVATLLIKFRPVIDAENIVFLISLIFGAILQEKLPFTKNINILLSVIVALAILNAYLWFI